MSTGEAPKKKKKGPVGLFLENFSYKVTAWAGSSLAFAIACLVILAWAITGPMFHYSDTWQLVINTGTTIVTFLMVFLIQRAQNKESRAVQLKLNEIVAKNFQIYKFYVFAYIYVWKIILICTSFRGHCLLLAKFVIQ